MASDGKSLPVLARVGYCRRGGPPKMSLTAEAAPYPVGHWMKSCSGLVARHEHVVAHDVGTTRQRILDGTNGRCSFTTLGQGRFAGFSEARARIGRIGVRF